MAKDRFGFGTEASETMMNDEAFSESEDSIGTWLRSKAFTEWLSEEWGDTDEKEVKAMLKAIEGSYPDDPAEARRVADTFINNLKMNKPGNPLGRGGLQTRGEEG